MLAKKIKDEIKDITAQVNDDLQLDIESPISGWISTGCTLLDLAITGGLPGGIPCGRITQIFGAQSTCKSVIATSLLGYAQRHGMICHYVDTEGTFDPNYALKFGLDARKKDTFFVTSVDDCPENIESLFDDYIKGVIESKKANVPGLIVVDTLTALPSKVGIETRLDESSYRMQRAVMIGEGLRNYRKPLAKNNIALVILDQTRTKVGVLFGNKETTSGGRGPDFYSTVRIFLEPDRPVKTKREDKDVVIGVWSYYTVVKNKGAAPYGEGSFRVIFNYGMDDIATNLQFLKVLQVGIKKSENVSELVEFNGQKLKSQSMIKYVEENNLDKELQKVVVDKWTEIYRPPSDRKPRSFE